MFARTVRALAALVLLGAATAGAATAAPGLQQVPAAFRGNDLFLKVSLNGAAPVWLIFDANAYASTLGAGAHAGRMTVKLGAVALQPVAFDIAKAPQSPRGLTVVGRLGRDSLGDRMLIIRTREHQVWLSPPVDTGPTPVASTSNPTAGGDPVRTASLAP